MKRIFVAACLSVFAIACAAPASARDLATGLKAYNAGNYAQAFAIWRPLAEKGNAGAQFNIASLLEDGKGMPQDQSEANRWYRKAAKQGHADAQFNLGNNLDKGRGVKADEREAIKWLTKAAEQSLDAAQFNLGMIYHRSPTTRDFAKARHWYTKAVANGHMNAAINLGALYNNGEGGPRDYGAAARLYRVAADHGLPLGMVYLGDLYDAGNGVGRDVDAAHRWYRRGIAAANGVGVRDASLRLAYRYQAGMGFPEDHVLACVYARIAARAGMKTEYALASQLAESINRTLTEAQRDEAHNLEWKLRQGVPTPDRSETWVKRP